MAINDINTLTYIKSLYSDRYRDLESFAKIFEIPIVQREVAELLKVLVRMNEPKRIVEVGTAIGYSSILMANESEAKVLTMEVDESIAHIARDNIENYGLEDRIDVEIGDAKDLLKNLEGSYDMAFIDAAKGQYKDYFDLIYPHISDGGLIISDNVLFRGMVSDFDACPRRQRTLVRKLREYLHYICNTEGLYTSILPVGDGLAISYKEKEVENYE